MIKIGVLGAGHLGKIHIRLLKEIDKYELIGFYDANPEAAKEVEKEFRVKGIPIRHLSAEDIVAEVEAIKEW